MRIVQVSTLYPPELHSGGTLACHQLALALKERGHKVSVFAGSSVQGEPALLEKDWVHEGIFVRALNVATGYGHVPQNYRNASAAERFERYVADVRPDVIHFHSIQALGADLLSAARRHAPCVALTMHDAWFLCAQQFLTTPAPQLRNCPVRVDSHRCDCIPGFDFVRRRAYLETALDNVDVVLAVSPFLKSVLEENGIRPGKIVVVENGLPPPVRIAPAARPSKDVRFGYLGGAHPWKGLKTLANAVPLVDRDFILELHGVDRGAWEAIGSQDPRVRCLPRFLPADLPRIMGRLDVVLLPSLVYESFSLVTREAYQHGRPVIASRCGGPESIVHDGQNGLLHDRGDAHGLAQAMRRFIDDRNLLARATRAAAATPVRTITEQAAEVEHAYRTASRARPMATTDTHLPSSIFFMAGMDGAPFRYRVGNLIEHAGRLGVRADARFYRDEEALALAGEHDILVLNRVPWDPYIVRVIERAREARALVVFAVDDMIFEPDAEIPALATLPRDTVERYWDGVRLFRQTLEAADAFLGSTDALAEAARAIGKPSFVVPNTMSQELIDLSTAAIAERDARGRTDRVRVGYFSGTDSHDRDFALVTPALRLALERNPAVDLVLGGHVFLPPELQDFEHRVERIPFVPWRELPRLLATLDVNLAPLETGYAFNDAKSELKWFEAAAVGVPTIASATRPFRAAIRHGVDGLVVAEPTQWFAALESVISDAELRRHMGEAARASALERNGPAAGTFALKSALAGLAGLRTQPLRSVPRPTAEDLDAIRRSGIGIGHAAMEPTGLVPGPAQLSHAQPTPRLGDGTQATQPVFMPDGFLERVDLMIATYARVQRHDLLLKIVDLGIGEEIAQRRLPAEHACDNAWFAFDVGGIPTNEGRQLALVVSAPGARDGVSLYCKPGSWPGGAGACGSLRGIDLTYRTWMRPTPPADGSHHRDLASREPSTDLVDIERRLRIAEERLAAALVPPLTASQRLRRTAAWRVARRAASALRSQNSVGPSLPYTALRKLVRAMRPQADEADVELFMQKLQASTPYRAARDVYRALRGR